MHTQSTRLYDLLYSFKDYRKEATGVKSILDSRLPGCRTVLDVGCGTAEHHRYLKEDFLLDGLDIKEEFALAAAAKNPAGTYHVADMTRFSLGRQYDAVISLFSSIGYVKAYDHLCSALACMYDHLREGGLAVVEPWFTPSTWNSGKVHMLTYDSDEIKICRMNRSETQGRLSVLHFHYLAGTPADGVQHFEERHELGLFTVEEMTRAFKTAGFKVEYEAEGLTGRGIYIGFKPVRC